MKQRKPVPAKTKALLQQEINSRCPFCDNTDAGHFQTHHIDGDPSRNEFINLLMVCSNCHSKISKGDILTQEVIQKKAFLAARTGAGSRNKSIFTAKEDREFEYIREKLDRLIRVLAEPTENEDLGSKKAHGYWDFSVSALEHLLMCYTEDSKSLGMYDSWEKDREAIINTKDGQEKRFRIATTRNFYDPIPDLTKCGFVKTKKDWDGRREYTKKMHTFVHWIEYHRIQPKTFEYEYKKIR